MLLNCHTYYSFRYGTLSPEELLRTASELGHDRIAVTDINNTAAALSVLRLAPQYGVHVAVGVDFRNGARQCFTALAKNNTGFERINRFLSDLLHRQKRMPLEAPPWPEREVIVIYPVDQVPKRALRPEEYVGVTQDALFRTTWRNGAWPEDRMVALSTVTFRNKRDFNAHRLLRSIDNNCLLSKLPAAEVGSPANLLMTPDELKVAFSGRLAWLHRSSNLLEQCNVYFGFDNQRQPQNQQTYTGSVEKDYTLLRKLCLDGISTRYARPGRELFDRVSRELKVIREKNYVAYFLINWDIVHYAQRRGYFYVGRGSGANSVVAYLLKITNVDPIELNLYFERFINLHRSNPPDFDIDFSWRDRDEVTDYIFKHFPNTALLGTYNTFQFKAVVRELGKVFGMPKHEIDVLANDVNRSRSSDPLVQCVLKYSRCIQNFPSHLGIHSSGIVISKQPLQAFSATFMPPKGFPTTQFDMVVAEDIGLYKFDILSQRGLSKIQDTLEIIRYNQPEKADFDIHDLSRFKVDEAVKDLLRRGATTGCFYVESPAMRMLLSKLRVDNYPALVAASSIIRPGVARSGMMQEYILRYRFPERRKEANPVLLEIMPETFGVMVYQEDVIRVAHIYAGLSPGEADILRRGMSGKYRFREEFQQVREKFFLNCAKKGYPDAEVAEVWRQIESFAGYTFAKGHSASYAVESYQSLFLKAHFPLEYMVSVINNFGGFYRTEFYVHEARMHGADIQPPCVNRGDFNAVINDKTIYLGFVHLQSLEESAARRIVAERKKGGAFRDFDDFIDRVGTGIEQVSILIRAGAFRFTGKPSRTLLWEAHLKVSTHRELNPAGRLFRNASDKPVRLPVLHHSRLEDAFEQIDLFGFPLCNPFLLLQNKPESDMTATKLMPNLGQNICIYGYLVAVKDTRTSKGQRMQFATFLDREGRVFDTVHFPQVAVAWPFRGRGIYKLTGKVVVEFDFYSIEVSQSEKTAIIPDPRYAEEPVVRTLQPGSVV